MIKKTTCILIATLLLLGCTENRTPVNKSVKIAISADIQAATPIYMYGISESIIFEETNLALVGHKWDSKIGYMTDYPLLAKDWKWNEEFTEITFNLREDVTWSDGYPFTAEDVVFTYQVYSDPNVESVFNGWFEKFYRDDEGRIDTDKSFEIITPNKIKFIFPPDSHPTLLETDLPLIAKHKFENIKKEDIKTSDAIFSNCGTGPYKLKKWERNQFVLLEKRKDHFLATESAPDELIFKVVPEYISRKNQLINGEVDIVNEIKTEDIDELSGDGNLKLYSMAGRNYDFAAWNNIDPDEFQNGKIINHKLFGNPEIRKALTYAVNRQTIIDELLLGYGEIANGPISKIFTEFYVQPETEYKYSPEKASEILKKEGWEDRDKNGILEKDGIEFNFTLNFSAGKPIREQTARIIKANLKRVGIEVKTEALERGVFIDRMYSRKLDAFISGWQIPIPLQMKPFWYSNLETNLTNTAGFRDGKIDSLIDLTIDSRDPDELKKLYKQIQFRLEEKHPVTFLFWKDSYIAFNKRIKNMEVNPLGSVQRCWEWEMD